MPSAIEKPALQRVEFDDFDAVIAAIVKDGGVILKNFTTAEIVEQVNAEVAPWLEADKPWRVSRSLKTCRVFQTINSHVKGKLFPPETRRCTRLVGRSDTARKEWIGNDQLFRVLDHFLSKTTRIFYDDVPKVHTTKPILSTASTIDVRPGAIGQRLHRDDKVHHVDHADMTKTGYVLGSDVSMTLLIPGTASSVENGATLVCPTLPHCFPIRNTKTVFTGHARHASLGR